MYQVRKEVDALAGAAAAASADTRKAAIFCRGFASGTATLTAGVATVTGSGIPANAVVKFMLTTGGGTLGVGYKVTGVGTSGGFTVTSMQTTNATQTSDTSTLSWEATWPLFHADQTPSYNTGDEISPKANALTVTADTAVDLATSLTMCNQIRQVLIQHMADAVSHLAADPTNSATLGAVASDLTTGIAAANAHKAAFNAHLTQSGVHVFNDTLNTVSTTNASDLTTLEALVNAMKTAVNAHLGSAPAGNGVVVVSM